MGKFDVKKAVQAAAVMLKHSPGLQMPYLRLLKLLYIAERESLREVMRPVLGGKMVAMRQGPLHSEVYDLIKKPCEPWVNHIRLDEYDLELVSDPSDSELCDYEVELLSKIAEMYKGFTEWQLVDLTHSFEEWIKTYPNINARTSHRIHFVDILDAVGLQDQKQAIVKEMSCETEEDQSFRNTHAITCT
ncbi:MAG: Panacea domain-containing protein [Planctomycetota bacterium]